MKDFHYYILASIISADNDEFNLTEDQKQNILRRYDDFESKDWDYIFEPIPNDNRRNTLIEFFKETERD